MKPGRFWKVWANMIATRFAVAIHVLMLLASRGPRDVATSTFIADSVNTNPVVVRRITGQLSRAGLVRVRRGPGGAELTRSPALITLGDIWGAMHAGTSGSMFAMHPCPNQECPVGRDVQAVLGRAFDAAEAAMLDALRRTTLADLMGSLQAVAA